ncbi:hypothetical protein Slala05_14850 [Streptomyces lavendulae subsp. lavendulae]|nr:hypothetical protein Slala05_14850 [Streptomyces lavendulae subsp. lavendulae]
MAGGQVPDLRAEGVVDADGKELRQPLVVADDAEGPVFRVHEYHSGFDDAAQDLRQVEFPAHGHDGFEQTVQPVPGTPDLVDPYLEFVEQFVEAQPGNTAPGGVLASAHAHLRPEAMA